MPVSHFATTSPREEAQQIVDAMGIDLDAFAARLQVQVDAATAHLAEHDAEVQRDVPAPAQAAPPLAAWPANDTLPAPAKKKEALRHRLVWAVAAAVLVAAGLCATGGGVIVAFDLWPKPVRYGGAPHVKLPAEPVPADDAGADVLAGPRKAPRWPGPGR